VAIRDIGTAFAVVAVLLLVLYFAFEH